MTIHLAVGELPSIICTLVRKYLFDNCEIDFLKVLKAVLVNNILFNKIRDYKEGNRNRDIYLSFLAYIVLINNSLIY